MLGQAGVHLHRVQQ